MASACGGHGDAAARRGCPDAHAGGAGCGAALASTARCGLRCRRRSDCRHRARGAAVCIGAGSAAALPGQELAPATEPDACLRRGTSLTDDGLHLDRLDRSGRRRRRGSEPTAWPRPARWPAERRAAWHGCGLATELAAASWPARSLRPSAASRHDDRGSGLVEASHDMAFDQLAHARIAAAAGAAAEHHRDDVAVAALHRGHEIEAGGAGVAGLDAVDAFDLAEQPVVVAHRAGRDRRSSTSRNSGSSAGSAPGSRCRAAPGRARW